MKSFSLTRRLIAVVLVVELCSALAFLAVAGTYEGVSQFHAFDVMLDGRADSVLGAVKDAEDAQDNVMLDVGQAHVPKRDLYCVWDESGRVLGRSANWPETDWPPADWPPADWPPADHSVRPGSGERRFRSVRLHGRGYRVLRTGGIRVVDAEDRGGGIVRRVTIVYGSPTRPVWRTIGHALVFYSGATLVLLVGTGLLLFSLLKRGMAPLHEIAQQAGQVSVTSWHFSLSSEARRVRELAPLVEALETALGGLERSFAQQAQFVSDAAHELKTSVAVVKSSVQVLMMRTRSTAEYEAGLERVQMDCERMEELVGNMLTLARVEASEGAQEETLVEAGGVLRQVAEQFRTLAALKRVAVHVTAAEAVWVGLEREQLRLVCSNLLHNALQHSREGGGVELTVQKSGEGWAELRVRDEGEGIAASVLPYVFDRFYRADPSRSRRTGGTGLGLAITKAMVTRGGGRIRLESVEGEGTLAVVEFPLVRAGEGNGARRREGS